MTADDDAPDSRGTDDESIESRVNDYMDDLTGTINEATGLVLERHGVESIGEFYADIGTDPEPVPVEMSVAPAELFIVLDLLDSVTGQEQAPESYVALARFHRSLLEATPDHLVEMGIEGPAPRRDTPARDEAADDTEDVIYSAEGGE